MLISVTIIPSNIYELDWKYAPRAVHPMLRTPCRGATQQSEREKQNIDGILGAFSLFSEIYKMKNYSELYSPCKYHQSEYQSLGPW